MYCCLNSFKYELLKLLCVYFKDLPYFNDLEVLLKGLSTKYNAFEWLLHDFVANQILSQINFAHTLFVCITEMYHSYIDFDR